MIIRIGIDYLYNICIGTAIAISNVIPPSRFIVLPSSSVPPRPANNNPNFNLTNSFPSGNRNVNNTNNNNGGFPSSYPPAGISGPSINNLPPGMIPSSS